MTIEFKAWPKTPRLFRDITISEKIDGTNAAVIVHDDGSALFVGAQSRNRVITPEQDNAGFARWVEDNRSALAMLLGPGHHYGEWWGAGIQRRYGLTEKRFSLFNVNRYADVDVDAVPGLGLVPVLYTGMFSQAAIDWAVDELRLKGSQAAPGFMNPEGIIVHHSQSGQVYKVLLENDQIPKSLAG